MKTWEVLKYLIENPNSDKVFISEQKYIKYDIYIDDYSKDIIIDELPDGFGGWIYKTSFNNSEMSKLLLIDNWKCD